MAKDQRTAAVGRRHGFSQYIDQGQIIRVGAIDSVDVAGVEVILYRGRCDPRPKLRAKQHTVTFEAFSHVDKLRERHLRSVLRLNPWPERQSRSARQPAGPIV
jgi:hypothetical protein